MTATTKPEDEPVTVDPGIGIGQLLRRLVVALYLMVEERPIPCGSGFFVRTGTTSYLVTAAHVLDEAERTKSMFFFSGPNTITWLRGRAMRTEFQVSRRDDRLDVGVLKLFESGVPRYAASAVDVSHLRPAQAPRTNRLYAVVGYPASKNNLRLSPEKHILSQPFLLLSHSIPEAEYSQFRTTPLDHIILSFPRKNLQSGFRGRRIHAPNPLGISGAPVFSLFDWPDDFSEVRLNAGKEALAIVGVLIEYRRRGRGVLIATDASHVISAINDLD